MHGHKVYSEVYSPTPNCAFYPWDTKYTKPSPASRALQATGSLGLGLNTRLQYSRTLAHATSGYGSCVMYNVIHNVNTVVRFEMRSADCTTLLATSFQEKGSSCCIMLVDIALETKFG